GSVYVDEDGVAWQGEADYGTLLVAPSEIPSKPMTASQEFAFDAWRTADGVAWQQGDTLVADVVYQVNFTATYRQYTVTFSVGGHEYASYRLHYGDTVQAPELPEPDEEPAEGYHWECKWVGWSQGYRVTRDITFVYLCEEVEDE
ncbi:MAG: hypothetical protein J5755_01400, partial [Clostridia bacterium]|nr:hypothetical protein [Clostridia bacterium]